MEELLKQLKFNLRESMCPFFSDEELEYLLKSNDNDLFRASYEGLLMKSEDQGISLPRGFKIPSNKNYWLGLARYYRGKIIGRDRGSRALSRADQC